MKRRLKLASGHVRRHKHHYFRWGGIGLALVAILQLAYPTTHLPLFASVDGVNLSGWSKEDATKRLNAIAKEQRLNVKLGSDSRGYDEPKPADIGVSISNADRVAAMNYPWYMKLIPTSALWFGLLQGDGEPKYTFNEAKANEYVTAKLGKDCVIPPKDANLKLSEDSLVVVPAVAGGTCNEAQAIRVLSEVRPKINSDVTVTIPVTITAPIVGDDDAQSLADTLNKNSQGGVELKVIDATKLIPKKDVLSWLTFEVKDGTLKYAIDAAKANEYMAKNVTPAVSRPAGVTKVSTLDFAETSRSDGATGQTLALDKTLADISMVLDGGKQTATAAVAPLPPKVEYTRSYTKSSTGIAAQLRFYDEDNPGVMGVTFTELGGSGLSARHNSSRQFVTASTYKLFVAFSTLKRIDSGEMKWSDENIASGRNLSTCFDDMIARSDNPCAEALIKKIGAKGLNADIQSLGLTSSAFRADNNVTTSDDLANYLTQLERGTMPLKPESRQRLLAAMKQNIYRQGVPAGASGQTADKVGFLWGLLHDATIVYSPKGTYVLTVMTDGSSWAAIADLTRKIEALR